jgi:hypothetical protein
VKDLPEGSYLEGMKSARQQFLQRAHLPTPQRGDLLDQHLDARFGIELTAKEILDALFGDERYGRD